MKNYVLISAVLGLSVSSANAAYTGKLEFIEPDANVSPTDVIPIWLRLTMDANSDPLVLTGDSSDTPPFGVDPSIYPTQYDRYENATQTWTSNLPGRFTVVNSIYLNVGYGGGETFTNSPSGTAPYTFEFNYNAANSLIGLNTISVQPGASYEYLLGTYTPTGSVSDGTYTFDYSVVSINFQGVYEDTNGDPCFADPADGICNGYIDFANTSNSTPFTRTVTSVPVPGAVWLFGSAFIGLASFGRRKQAAL